MTAELENQLQVQHGVAVKPASLRDDGQEPPEVAEDVNLAPLRLAMPHHVFTGTDKVRDWIFMNNETILRNSAHVEHEMSHMYKCTTSIPQLIMS